MGIFDSLKCWIGWLAKTLYSYMIDAVELVLTVIFTAANAVLWLLPTAAIGRPQLDTGVIGALNYILPMGEMVAVFGVLMVAWIAYRVYQWLLKLSGVAE